VYEYALTANVEIVPVSKTLNYRNETEMLQWTRENASLPDSVPTCRGYIGVDVFTVIGRE
jgi:hypothetical protein